MSSSRIIEIATAIPLATADTEESAVLVAEKQQRGEPKKKKKHQPDEERDEEDDEEATVNSIIINNNNSNNNSSSSRSRSINNRRFSSEFEHTNYSLSEKKSRVTFTLLGIITGFLVQVVSLGAYAVILIHYPPPPTTTTNDSQEAPPGNNQATASFFSFMTGVFSSSSFSDNITHQSTVFHTMLCILTRLDLVVYVLIWILFTCALTQQGMAFLRHVSSFFTTSSSFSNDDDNDDDHHQESSSATSTQQNSSTNKKRRRYVFVLFVLFLAGILLGAFVAWSVIDVYLEFPIPFTPIIMTVMIDLALCYSMIVCYDFGGGLQDSASELLSAV